MTSTNRRSRIMPILAVTGIAVSAAMWSLEIVARSTKASVVSFGRHQILPLNGILVPLDEFLTAESTSVNRPARPVATLVVAFADDCPACIRDAPKWSKFLPLVSPDDEVILVSFKGADLVKPLVAALDHKGVPWKILRVTNNVAFGARTGIGATPTVLLLDDNHAVRAVIEDVSDDSMRVAGAAAATLHRTAVVATNVERR